MNSKNFNKDNAIRETHKLQLMHTYLIVSFQIKSLESHLYALTFIDDCSKMDFIYFLKNKLEYFEMFMHFKALVKNC